MFATALFGRSMEAMAQAPDAESVLREREAALLARNVEGVVALFADDADVTTSSGRRFMNKEGIRGWVQDQADRSQREEVVGSRRMQGGRLAWSARIYRADWQNLGVSPLDVTQEAIVEGSRIKLFITAFTPESAAKLDAARAAAQPGSAPAAAPGPSALPRTGNSPGLAGTIVPIAAAGVTLLLAGLALRRPRGYTDRT